MSKLSKHFRTDNRAETGGVVLDYGDGVKIRIARAGGSNARYLSRLDQLARRYRRQIQLDTLPDSVAREMMRRLYAETVVLGWEGVTGEDFGREGDTSPVAFSVDNCIALFECLPDLFLDVQAQASSIAVFRSSLDEGDAGN